MFFVFVVILFSKFYIYLFFFLLFGNESVAMRECVDNVVVYVCVCILVQLMLLFSLAPSHSFASTVATSFTAFNVCVIVWISE